MITQHITISRGQFAYREAGHFVQEEKPVEVVGALLGYWQSELFSGRG